MKLLHGSVSREDCLENISYWKEVVRRCDADIAKTADIIVIACLKALRDDAKGFIVEASNRIMTLEMTH